MFNRSKGFTLIELLIVVAIIGILAALLIPNAVTAMQKARQKGTMKDINTIATNLTDYITDHGAGPNNNGDAITSSGALWTALIPFYTKALPPNDQWGNPFYVYCGTGWTVDNITPAAGVADEYVVKSYGRDNADSWDWDASSGAFLYVVDSTDDFNNDIVNWNGQFVCAPRTSGATGT